MEESVRLQIHRDLHRRHILEALADLDQKRPHPFGDSTGYDLAHDGRRYPPKAVYGLAAEKLNGRPLGPYDFKGGLRTYCFRTLEKNGFVIVRKSESIIAPEEDYALLPEEIDPADKHFEGDVISVKINRYERDPKARKKSLAHHGAKCLVCNFDFEGSFGEIGKNFIHIHHIIPLSEVGHSYVVDPINDLKPVCPNCHAMLHRRKPPFTLKEMQTLISQGTNKKGENV